MTSDLTLSKFAKKRLWAWQAAFAEIVTSQTFTTNSIWVASNLPTFYSILWWKLFWIESKVAIEIHLRGLKSPPYYIILQEEMLCVGRNGGTLSGTSDLCQNGAELKTKSLLPQDLFEASPACPLLISFYSAKGAKTRPNILPFGNKIPTFHIFEENPYPFHNVLSIKHLRLV